MNSFDVIGDIHGHYGKLKALLQVLGYQAGAGTWRHPDGRRVLFLGDFIDRGPRIRRVLHLVRGMCDAGHAFAVMGNHEYNAICYHEPPERVVPDVDLAALPGYGADEPPVFVGHYWMPAHSPLAPLRPNIACLDYSAADGGPLVAYRWDGEKVLSAEKFIATHGVD